MPAPDPTQAWAEITGTYPNQVLNLNLPRGDRGEKGDKGDKGDQGDIGLSNTLTVLGTATGPDVPGTPGPQGLKGDKGDAGGFTLGVDYGGDLNTLLVSGIYRNSTSAFATAPNNYPAGAVGIGCIVEVMERNANSIFQRVTPAAGTNGGYYFYERFSTSAAGATWSPWRMISGTRVDQTAGRAIYQWDDVNNREQLIYGDTGWRDVTASITAPFTVNGLHIRRVHNRVTLHWDSLTSGPSAAPTGSAFTAPTGFVVSNRDPSYYGRAVLQQAANSIGNIWSYGWNSATLIPQQCIGSWFSGAYFNGGFTYLTDDPWPTTLPGTALGTVPNV
jgi:hypothetical protein